MKLSDDIWAVLFLVLAIVLFVSGMQFDPIPGQNVGAGTFPKVLGCVLGVCSILLYWTKGRKSNSTVALMQWVQSPYYLGNFATVIAALLFFAVTAGMLGYHLSVFISVTAMLRKFGSTWRTSFVCGLATTLLSHLFFYKVLRVPLPWGLLPVIY